MALFLLLISVAPGWSACSFERKNSTAASNAALPYVSQRRAAGHGPKYLLLLGVNVPIRQTQVLSLAPAQVVIIRHGEKPSSGPDLNKRGNRRADALVHYFENDPTMTQYGMPAAIYAMQQHRPSTSARPIETVQPLADDLGMDINDQYLRDDYQGMVSDIMSNPAYDGGTVVICWEHNVIPSIAKAFGATAAPADWDGNSVYDRSWVLSFNGSAPPSFQDLPQHVLPGDDPASS